MNTNLKLESLEGVLLIVLSFRALDLAPCFALFNKCLLTGQKLLFKYY